MSSEGPQRRVPMAFLATVVVAVVVCLAVGALPPVRALLARLIDQVRAAGPGWFFAAMALAPVPISWFAIPAGEVFGAQFTLPGVVALACAAAAGQIIVWYWLARSALRPVVARWLERRGQRVPTVSRENAASVTLLAHIVPGPPSYLVALLLGAARVPFGIYFVISWLITIPWVVAGVVLGRGMLAGNLRFVLTGVGLLAVATLAACALRRRLPQRA